MRTLGYREATALDQEFVSVGLPCGMSHLSCCMVVEKEELRGRKTVDSGLQYQPNG
jgi:hypothetical protein